jgi:diguanylate cyclase (GGDEF)-like protein
MFIGGALSSYAGAVTVQVTPAGQQSQAILATLLLLWGGAILVLRPRAPLFRAAALAAVGIVSGMMATAQPVSATEFFYLWPLVFTAYFLGRRSQIAVLAFFVVTLAIGLAISTDHIVKTDVFTSTISSVGLITGLVALMRERERRLTGRLEVVARTDALTGLLNRHGLAAELDRHVAHALATGVPLAVALFDLDHFKWFNDAHGHLVGDAALRRVGAVLRATGRGDDCVSRFGGEEFAVVLPGAKAEGACAFAERVALALAAEDIVDDLRLTTSCGVAQLRNGDTIEAVLARADEALYAAKDGGRNRTAWWDRGHLMVGRPLTDSEQEARRKAARAPREFVVRMADRAREVEPEEPVSTELTVHDGSGEGGEPRAGSVRRDVRRRRA